MDFETLRVERLLPVARVTLDRPHSLNALSLDLIEELTAALDDLLIDDSIRAVILTGAGKAFSAGADLAATLADLPRDEHGEIDLAQLLRKYYNPLLLKMRAAKKPIIAAVNGVAAGGASSLALMADLTIAGRSTRFAQAFVRVGLIPDIGGSWLLARALGPQRALGLALLGADIDACEAHACGLIWQVVDDQSLQDEAERLAHRLAQVPTVGFLAIKQAIQLGAVQSVDAQLQTEAELQGRCGRAEFHALASAFLARSTRPISDSP